jgi:hypothetical protein
MTDKRRGIIDMMEKMSDEDTKDIFKLFVAMGITRDNCIKHKNRECSINLDILADDIINSIYSAVHERSAENRRLVANPIS